jgi:transcriptional regulator with XRE-family HTH domain
MESLRLTFGRRVRALRETHGWSQERLGKAAGLGGKYIGIIERGEKTASFEAIERIARALCVDCYELFVPMNRRTEAVEDHVRSLVSQTQRIELSNVEDFLKSLGIALRKLDRQSKHA